MENNDFEKFGKLLIALGEIYSKVISPAVIKLYWAVLRQYDFPVIEKAVGDIVSSHKYNTMPLPAHFIDAISPPSTIDLKVLDAIKTMETTMIIAGSYQSVVFIDPILTATIEQFGGWIELCRQTSAMSDRDYTFFLKEFERIYRSYNHRDMKTKILLGRTDRDNLALGYLDESNLSTPYCPDGEIIYTENHYLLPDGQVINIPKSLDLLK